MPDRWLHTWEGEVARLDAFTTDGRLLSRTHEVQSRMRPASRELPLPLTTSAAHIGFVCSLRLGDWGNSIVASGLLDLNELDTATRVHLLDGRPMEAGANLEVLKRSGQDGIELVTDWRVLGVCTGMTYRSAWAELTTIRLQTGEYADLNRWTS